MNNSFERNCTIKPIQHTAHSQQVSKPSNETKVNAMVLQKAWRVFLSSFLILITSYAIYFVRYPIWGWSMEPIFAVLILSYLVILILAIILIKKDLKKSISSFFGFHGSQLILVGLGLAFLFQALWYGINLATGAKLEFLTFPMLRGYELYTYYSLSLAFALYAVFSTFGAFAEEVTYRGYVQTRISAKYGVAVGIIVSTIFFSLQHIHVFQLPWIETSFKDSS